MPQADDQGNVVEEQKLPEAIPVSDETNQDGSGELPEDAKERTRIQFEKMKEHNRQLKEENDRLKASQPTIAESFRPVEQVNNLNPFMGQPVETKESFVDPEGYLDASKLETSLAKQREETKKALEATLKLQKKVEQMEENEIVQKVHASFPQLNPRNEGFNEKFFNAVKNEVVQQMINGEKDYMKAASKVAEWFPLNMVDAKSKELQDKREQQLKVSNAATPSSRSTVQTRSTPQEVDELVKRTRLGDQSALAERLRRAGF